MEGLCFLRRLWGKRPPEADPDFRVVESNIALGFTRTENTWYFAVGQRWGPCWRECLCLVSYFVCSIWMIYLAVVFLSQNLCPSPGCNLSDSLSTCYLLCCRQRAIPQPTLIWADTGPGRSWQRLGRVEEIRDLSLSYFALGGIYIMAQMMVLSAALQ